jgi:hypothetical protein
VAKLSPVVERAVRIELLRAQAAVEREVLIQNVADLGVSLSPSHLVKGLLPTGLGGLGGLTSGNAPRLALQAFSLMRRYPVVLSSLSAVFLGGNKRSKLVKLATGAVVGWQVFRAWRSSHADGPAPADKNPPPGV